MTAHTERRSINQISDPLFEVLFVQVNPILDGVNLVGQIASWFGTRYASNSKLTPLDIAVLDRR